MVLQPAAFACGAVAERAVGCRGTFTVTVAEFANESTTRTTVQVITLTAGHASLASKPVEVAALINEAAKFNAG